MITGCMGCSVFRVEFRQIRGIFWAGLSVAENCKRKEAGKVFAAGRIPHRLCGPFVGEGAADGFAARPHLLLGSGLGRGQIGPCASPPLFSVPLRGCASPTSTRRCRTPRTARSFRHGPCAEGDRALSLCRVRAPFTTESARCVFLTDLIWNAAIKPGRQILPRNSHLRRA